VSHSTPSSNLASSHAIGKTSMFRRYFNALPLNIQVPCRLEPPPDCAGFAPHLGYMARPQRLRVEANSIHAAPPTWRWAQMLREGERHMRLFFGIILGIALTVGGAYVADSMAGTGAARMVNWDVVSKNFDDVTNALREGWRKLTG
jgi:hypothetical protein